MSLCDRCPAPGACCQAMNLHDRKGNQRTIWDDQDAAAVLVEDNPELHSFVPKARIGTWTVPDDDPEEDNRGRSYSTWLWGCTALDQSTGRCSRWETRPGLCARYEPASGDGLCVFSQAMENGEESTL